jgi:ABC-type spermidine/putrescine transport system permease subunit I
MSVSASTGMPRLAPWRLRLRRAIGEGGAGGRLWLLLPAALLYGALLLLPLCLIVKTSLSGGFVHYRDVLSTPVLWRVIENTVVISAITTAVAVLLAYAFAAALWRAGPLLRLVLFGLVLLPFWTGVLVKNFAWAALLQDNGAINGLLGHLGLIDGHVSLLHNRLAVVIGMVHYVLPYAVFPIYAAMIGIDLQLQRAARSLGASAARAVWRVVIPLSLPGVYAGALLVFIISTGFFITPVILGGTGDMMIANLVDFYAHQIVDFEGAAALAVLVVAAVSVLVFIYQRLPREGQYGAV